MLDYYQHKRLPNKKDLTPRYDQQKIFSPDEFNFFKIIAAPTNEAAKINAVSLNANAQFWLARYNKSEKINFTPTLFKNFWVQIIKGELLVNEHKFFAGDAFAYSNQKEIQIEIQDSGAEFLIIEVA